MSHTKLDAAAPLASPAVVGPLPLIAVDAVPAGFPSPAQDYYSGPVDLNKHLMTDPTATFIVRVSGNSMTGTGIYDGDELIVDRSLEPTDGRVVVAVVNGELTVKRLLLGKDGVRLAAENPAYPDVHLDEASELTIWGVVTRCLHRV